MNYIATFVFIFILSCHRLNAASSFPIDIVYTWVDGNDPDWKKIKNHYLNLSNQEKKVEDDSSSDSRFNDHEELKYSLRSIWQYAPFVRHIYIVTMGQKPHWIKPHDKITFIDHKDIFVNLEDLPTFNSQAIECHLHRINNLSEHFIYFNDDVFLGSPLEPHHFFSPEGLPLVFLEPNLSPKGNPNDKTTLYRKAWCNTNRILDMHYSSMPRFRLRHAPFALRRSFIDESLSIFPEVFKTNSSHKFRHETDCNLTNGLLQYDWIHREKCHIGHISNLMVSLRSCAYQTLNVLEFQKLSAYNPATFCIEDVTSGYCKEAEELLKNFLENKYPHKAPWEN